MKTAIIAHGWSGSPDEPMLRWIREYLQSKGFNVFAPVMPHPDIPTIKDWVHCLATLSVNMNEDTYLIGHSVGCQTILRYLETLEEEVKIGKLILIAPWIKLTVENLDEEEEEEIARPWMETPIDFGKVLLHTRDIVGIFSDNDPFVPVEENKKIFEEVLNAKVIILKNKGHFTADDGVSELPELLEEIK